MTEEELQPQVEESWHDHDDEAADSLVEQEEEVLLSEETLPADEQGLVDEQEPVPSEEDDGRRWYVVHCYSGYENKVQHAIEQRIETMGMEDKIFDVIVPTEEEMEIKDGKRRVVERRVFPGYILVQMILGEDSWYVVRNTPGVTGFVASGSRPIPLEEAEVNNILNRMKTAVPRVKLGFVSGDNVRIIDGPFAEFIGTVDEINLEKGKVKLMVSFFGRETPIELELSQVQTI